MASSICWCASTTVVSTGSKTDASRDFTRSYAKEPCSLLQDKSLTFHTFWISSLPSPGSSYFTFSEGPKAAIVATWESDNESEQPTRKETVTVFIWKISLYHLTTPTFWDLSGRTVRNTAVTYTVSERPDITIDIPVNPYGRTDCQVCLRNITSTTMDYFKETNMLYRAQDTLRKRKKKSTSAKYLLRRGSRSWRHMTCRLKQELLRHYIEDRMLGSCYSKK